MPSSLGVAGQGAEPGPAELERLRQRVTELEQQPFNAHFREVVNAAPFLLWISGQDGRCTFFNRPWLDFRGRTFEQEVGDGWLDGVHTEDRDFCMQTYRLAFQARRPFRMEYRLQRADGAYRWVVDSGNPWFDSNGGFLGYIGCGLDITDLRGERPGARIRLTGREREVLTLIAQGKTTKEVGRQLGITYKTADSHRSNIMEKLEAHGTAALVRYAIRIGLVDP